jgi:hypothetical protein
MEAACDEAVSFLVIFRFCCADFRKPGGPNRFYKGFSAALRLKVAK